MITSKSNPLVKKINSLKEKKYRIQYGEFIVEGYKQVQEALASHQTVVCIVYSPRYNGNLTQDVRSVAVSAEVFEKLSEEVSPQGILAVLKIPETAPKKPIKNVLLLDGVSDPGNLGTIIRTANGAGYCDIYLKNCTDPFAPKCVRAAMSGIFFIRLHMITEADIPTLFADIPLICADMNGEDLYRFTPPERYGLVIGNEANGVSSMVREQCFYTVRIPMRECCESLNAGVSAGIIMYHLQYCLN